MPRIFNYAYGSIGFLYCISTPCCSWTWVHNDKQASKSHGSQAKRLVVYT